MSQREDSGVGPDSRPYESLYRHGNPTPPERTDPGWARHSGIHHDPADSPEGDRYAWLFRAEEPTRPDVAGAGSGTGELGDHVPAHSAVEEDTRTRVRPEASVPAETPAGSADQFYEPYETPLEDRPPAVVTLRSPARAAREPTDREPGRRRGLLVALLLLLVVLLVAGGAWLVWGEMGAAGRSVASPQTTASGRGPTATSSTPPSGSASKAYAGAVTAVQPTAATADCTAPDATDDGGKKVSYTAGRVIDGDATTAWRCDGAGIGEQVTIHLPAGTTVAELGLVNGYTKVDPTSAKDRYREYRRILDVTWTVGDRRIPQTLSGTDEKMQSIRIPPTAADQLVLTIDKSTTPGSKAATRDAVLISEVMVGSPA